MTGGEGGFARVGKPREAGFALIEMLVAMLILSLVGLTLARFQSLQLTGTANIAAVSAARLEADNLAVDMMAMREAPTGRQSGESSNAGRRWYWQSATSGTPDPKRLPDMVRIEIGISGGPGQPVLVRREIMRPLIWPVEEGGSAPGAGAGVSQ